MKFPRFFLKKEKENIYLLIPKLNQPGLINHNLIAFVFAVLEQLRQGKPLSGHLVAIVGVDELIVVDTVGRVPLDALHRRLAAVEGDDVVDEALTGGREGQAFTRVGRVVFGRVRLARLEVFARRGSGDGAGGDGRGCGGHSVSEKWGEVLLATEEAVGWGEETSAEHANGVRFETL